ncbi:MAG: hypothetical protein V4637_10665 [Pseudomonadota bacterium]
MTSATIPVAPAGLSFLDLYEHDGLKRLDALFLDRLVSVDAPLHESLLRARATPDALKSKQESELLIALAPHVDDFVAWVFGIEDEVAALSARHHALAPLFGVKRNFVQRKAMHKIKLADAQGLDGEALAAALQTFFGEPVSELAFARHVLRWQHDEAANAQALELALKYAVWAALTPAGRDKHRTGVLFKAPHKLDPAHLVSALVDTTQGFPSYRFQAHRSWH